MILGIDLGVTGAFAYLTCQSSAGKFVSLYDFPDDYRMLHKTITSQASPVLAVLENVHSTPGDRNRLTSFEKLMTNKGMWLGTLAALGIPVLEVAPLKWQNAIFDKSTAGTDSKIRSVELARKLFPKIGLMKSHHNRADALLIALYGVRYWRDVYGLKGAGR